MERRKASALTMAEDFAGLTRGAPTDDDSTHIFWRWRGAHQGLVVRVKSLLSNVPGKMQKSNDTILPAVRYFPTRPLLCSRQR